MCLQEPHYTYSDCQLSTSILPLLFPITALAATPATFSRCQARAAMTSTCFNLPLTGVLAGTLPTIKSQSTAGLADSPPDTQLISNSENNAINIQTVGCGQGGDLDLERRSETSGGRASVGTGTSKISETNSKDVMYRLVVS